MKHLLSRILLALCTVLGATSLTSCDKMDDNGPFYGYWILTRVDGPEGCIGTLPVQGTASAETDEPLLARTITWGVRNELLQLHDMREVDFYYFTFTRTDKELQLNAAFYNDGSNDTAIHFDEVPEKFFVPADGHYRIKDLDGEAMVLEGGDLTLTFKKN